MRQKEGCMSKLGELWGVEIFIDNRIAYGTILPDKRRTAAIRCSEETLRTLIANIEGQRQLGKSYLINEIYRARVQPTKIMIGVTTA